MKEDCIYMIKDVTLGVIMLLMSTSCSNSTTAAYAKIEDAKNTDILIKKKYSFAECTIGSEAIPLKDGGYIISGYTLQKMVRDKYDSIVFDKKCGFMLRVDSNLEKKWLRVYEQRYDSEFRSVISVNDSTYVSFSDILDMKTRHFTSQLVLFFDQRGKILNELVIPIANNAHYSNKGAITTIDGNIILYGSVNKFNPKLEWYFIINKIDRNGKRIAKLKILEDWANDCCMINANNGDIYFVGATSNFKDLKLIKLTKDLKILWEKTFPVGFNPKLDLTNGGGVILICQDIENGNDLVGKVDVFDKDGNSIWCARIEEKVPKCITHANNDTYEVFSYSSRSELITISKLSAKGAVMSNDFLKIDSVLYTSRISRMQKGNLFIMGQEQMGPLGSYDSKLVLIKTKSID